MNGKATMDELTLWNRHTTMDILSLDINVFTCDINSMFLSWMLFNPTQRYHPASPGVETSCVHLLFYSFPFDLILVMFILFVYIFLV